MASTRSPQAIRRSTTARAPPPAVPATRAARLATAAEAGALARPLAQTEDAIAAAYAAAPGVRRVRLGDRSLLFSETRQQLFELNASADAIWSGLIRGDGTDRITEELRAMG